MTIYDKYERLITEKKGKGLLTKEFVEKTTNQLEYYLKTKKITQKEFDELIKIMNPNK